MPEPPSLLLANKYSFQFRPVERILNGVLHRVRIKENNGLYSVWHTVSAPQRKI